MTSTSNVRPLHPWYKNVGLYQIWQENTWVFSCDTFLTRLQGSQGPWPCNDQSHLSLVFTLTGWPTWGYSDLDSWPPKPNSFIFETRHLCKVWKRNPSECCWDVSFPSTAQTAGATWRHQPLRLARAVAHPHQGPTAPVGKPAHFNSALQISVC